MSKVIIEFNLPEDQTEYQTSIKGGDYYCALFDIAMRIRETSKYDKEPISSEEFYNILYSYDITLD